MVENSVGSQMFAGRYLLESIDDEWDTGRTGFTHPAFDVEEKRRVVIKRADVTSPQARQHEHSLQNEAKALGKLKGLGVPELYDVNQAVYGYQKFPYLVMEFITGIRVEKELSSFSSIERARILLELFRLLAKAHKRGISNGDIDIKHLFWLREKQQLIIIDWGNSNISPYQKSYQITFDLARCAEIIYSLLTRDGTIPVTGSLALPEKEKLLPDLPTLPREYYNLCEWAPRNPSEDIHPPFSALELFAITKNWIAKLDPAYHDNDNELDGTVTSLTQHSPLTMPNWVSRILVLAIVFLIGVISLTYLTLSGNSAKKEGIGTSTTAPPVTSYPLDTTTPIPITANVTAILTEPSVLYETSTSPKTPLPQAYSIIIGFDNTLNLSQNPCWKTNTSYEILTTRDDNNWQFQIDKQNNLIDATRVNFSDCFNRKEIAAIDLNFWTQRQSLNSEFGIYIENDKGQRREYTLWIDPSDNTVYLRVREIDGSYADYIQLIIEPNLEGFWPSQYYQYSANLFLELNNQGLDILYLDPSSALKPLKSTDINPSQLRRVDGAVRPTFDNIQSVGLIGHGPDISASLWPLVFFENISK